MTRYFVEEKDLIDISQSLIYANDVIYGYSDERSPKLEDWDREYASVESLIEHIFKTQKLYKASLV